MLGRSTPSLPGACSGKAKKISPRTPGSGASRLGLRSHPPAERASPASSSGQRQLAALATAARTA